MFYELLNELYAKIYILFVQDVVQDLLGWNFMGKL